MVKCISFRPVFFQIFLHRMDIGMLFSSCIVLRLLFFATIALSVPLSNGNSGSFLMKLSRRLRRTRTHRLGTSLMGATGATIQKKRSADSAVDSLTRLVYRGRALSLNETTVTGAGSDGVICYRHEQLAPVSSTTCDSLLHALSTIPKPATERLISTHDRPVVLKDERCISMLRST